MTVLHRTITLSRAYSAILSVFPYTHTARVYSQLRTLAPFPWTCATVYVSVQSVFDMFTHLVPQNEMGTFLPRLVETLASDRLAPYEEIESAALRSTLRIRIPPEQEYTDSPCGGMST